MTDGLVQVGWMLSPELAAEFNVTPLSDDYLMTLEQAEDSGGIKDEYRDRVIPVYRLAQCASCDHPAHEGHCSSCGCQPGIAWRCWKGKCGEAFERGGYGVTCTHG